MHTYHFFSLSYWYWSVLGTFLLVPLSLSLSLSLSFFIRLVCSMTPKKSKSTPSRNSLCSRASTSDSTPYHVRFCDEKAHQDFPENFSRQGIYLEHQVVLSDFSNTDLRTIIYSKGCESLCGIPITCPSVIIHEFYSNMHGFDYSVPHFITRIWGTCIVVTPDLISEVPYIPRVEFADYPSYDRLRTVSKYELSSLFYETPSSWGDHQNTSCSGFAKGLRFLDMVMTFVLYPLSHYNFITEPRAWFLLSLLKGLTINFPSHFIFSLIDVYKDTSTHDKLIFHSTSTQILHHASVSYPESPHFPVMCVIDTATIR